MTFSRALLGGTVVGFAVALIASCGGKPTCNASNCQGCCDVNGECQPGTTLSACGVAAGLCNVCAPNQFCSAGLCTATGNGGGGGGNGDGGGSMGGDGGVTAPDGGAAGVWVGHYVTPNGVVDVPVDLTATPLFAYVEDGGVLESLPITGTPDGHFSVENVHGRPYYLRAGKQVFFLTDPAVDLGFDALGRPNAPQMTTGLTSLQVSATGLTPWQSIDSLELLSESTSAQGFATATNAIPDGTTTLTNEPFDYGAWVAVGLEAAQGDTAILAQSRYAEVGDADAGVLGYTALIAAADTGPVSLADTQPTSLNLAFTPVAQKTAAIDWRLDAYIALAASVRSDAKPVYGEVDIAGIPGGLERGWLGFEPLLTGTASDFVRIQGTVSYGNPRASWGELADQYAVYSAAIQLDGGTAGTVSATIGVDGPVSMLAANAKPVMSPPRLLQLDGVAAQQPGALTLSSATPTLSWSPPAVGTPTLYEVRVRELYLSSGKTRSTTMFFLHTPQTSIRIPPGLLESGKTYVCVVEAYARSGAKYDAQTAPNYNWTDATYAAAISSAFVVP